MSMKSYIAIHNFTPKKKYPGKNETKKLIQEAIEAEITKSTKNKISNNKKKIIKEKVYECMIFYNKLVGINEDVLTNSIEHPPKGLLPTYTDELLKYINNLENNLISKEIDILKYSGVQQIKIRYKHANSVIKKLVKIGFKNINEIEKPEEVFLNGGRLHDLIGIQFVCSYRYQREWVARALYNFFHIPNRTDDHLLHGFYNVSRKSGYRGLHCDISHWYPAFDTEFLEKNQNAITHEEAIKLINKKEHITNNILVECYKLFNIEIQIHTTIQNTWASMEHEKSYDILAKGIGKSKDITASWKMISDNLTMIEDQIELLQARTELSIFQDKEQQGYGFIEKILTSHPKAHELFTNSVKLLKHQREILINHEISRESYVKKLNVSALEIDEYLENNPNIDPSIIFTLKLQKAFIFYSYANHRDLFNVKDISNFIEDSLTIYNDIINKIAYDNNYRATSSRSLIAINAIIRYGRLMQKNGFGLVSSSTIGTDISTDDKQKTDYKTGRKYLGLGLYFLINIDEVSLNMLKNDNSSFFRTIHYFDKLSREIELSNEDNAKIIINDKEYILSSLIDEFRNKYMEKSLYEDFKDSLLGKNGKIIKNTGFIINFLSTMILNKLVKPIEVLKTVVRLSSHELIKASDIFAYEYASYIFLYEYKCEEVSDCSKQISQQSEKIKHYGDYHYQNMINLLFRIKKEDIYEFAKARAFFNNLSNRDNFKEDYLSNKLK